MMDNEEEEEGYGEMEAEEMAAIKTEPEDVEDADDVVMELSEEEGEEPLDEEINVTDSQVMIQLKEAEQEAETLRKEIAALRTEIADYECRGQLSEEDSEHVQDLQVQMLEKVAQLEELTKKIAKLMELAPHKEKSEDTTILDEEEEEGLPDDLLPRVVICSSWDDMMPKVVVCMDMKKPAAAKKKEEDDRDENGLTPEQREALERERRCMAEERNRLQYQIACLEGEMRVMMRENDMLCKKVTQLKADLEHQPPFEFEMSVSATNSPGTGPPRSGNMEMGYDVMGPNCGAYNVNASLAPGTEYQGTFTVAPPPQYQCPPRMPPNQQTDQGQPNPQDCQYPGTGKQLPCGGVTGVPGKSVPCPRLQPPEPPPTDWSTSLPPHGKKCRKDFNAAQGYNTCCGGGNNDVLYNACKPLPMDVNFKVNVQPQPGAGSEKRPPIDTESRSNKIAQQLQEIESELKKMQRDLRKAKNDKETLQAQQATLNCAKNYIM